jgi:predicted acyltransferase
MNDLNLLSQKRRATNLDALRGFAILTMVLSGTVPWGSLPAWMYHAQLPPPNHVFNPNLPGLTWVDLVFPFFLFAMGAAFPLALSKKLDQGIPVSKIIFSILERGVMLAIFAVFVMHIRPHKLSASPEGWTWVAALGGFIILFLVYLRPPKSWSVTLKRLIKVSGWLALILWLVFMKYPNGGGFSFQRNDIIIIVLTNMAVFGALIWLGTRNNLLFRLGILGFYLAFRLVHTQWDMIQAVGPSAEPVQQIGSVLFLFTQQAKNWMIQVWDYSPFPWLYQFHFLKYLFIVIPGTIAGDLTLRWLKRKEEGPALTKGNVRYAFLAVMMVLSILVVLAGLQSRHVFLTFVLCSAIALTAIILTRNPRSETEGFIRQLILWGSYWLVLGLLFEPFEGGIKKDHSTLSYYFVTSGLAFYLMTFFTVLIDGFKKQRWVNILILNGRNPMIAYVGMANFIWPVLHLTGIKSLAGGIFTTPWSGFLWSVIETMLLALFVSALARKKLFWKT